MTSPPQTKTRAPRGAKGLRQHARLEQFAPEVRRTAACVLEVLAGVRTPEQAARTLDLSLPTYYNVETRALRGLIAGCGPGVPGRSMVLTNQLRGAEVRAASLQKQVQRYQALLRATQRSVGLAPPAPAPGKPEGKRRRKKPSVRALRAAAALRESEPPGSPIRTEPTGPAAVEPPGEVVVA